MKVQRRPDFTNRQCGGFFVTLLVYAVLFVVSELLRPKPNIEDARPAGLGDFKFPTATEGRYVPLIWGTVKMEGPNVLWYGDLRQVAITEEVDTGIFSSEDVIIGFEYKVGVQMGLCRGPIDEISRIWIGEDLVPAFTAAGDGDLITFEDLEFFGGRENGNGGVSASMRVFGGTTLQTASPYLNSISVQSATVDTDGSGYAVDDVLTVVGGVGGAATFRVATVGGSGEVTLIELIDPGQYSILPASPAATTVAPAGGTGAILALSFGSRFTAESVSGQTPGYRGTCYVVPDVEPFYVGNSSSIKPWKFEVKRVPNGLALTGGDELINGADANPMNVMYELLTDDDWGLKQGASDVDIANFTAAASVLAAEGNGFSMILDKPLEAEDFKKEVERQIDGVVFFNLATSQWQVQLARFDYTVSALPKITAGVGVEVESFARGAWEDTTNIIRAQFNDRADEFKTTYALAQDMGNLAIQDGQNISSTVMYPGVKNRTLANNLAWRGLRTVSFPIAKATVRIDRTLWDLQPYEVVAFTDPDLGLVDLPMRITRINYGTLEDGTMRLDLVQDVFIFAPASFGDPFDTEWTPPVDDLLPFLASQQLAFEAPRALVQRNPLSLGAVTDLIYCAARQRGAEYKFDVRERHHPTTPTGNFLPVGGVVSFALIGQLDSTLAVGTAVPTASVDLTPTPDVQDVLEAAFTDGLGTSILGTNLRNLIYIGGADGEFAIAGSASISATEVRLNTLYRGVLDTVQQSHAAGTPVYLVFVGGGLSQSSIPPMDVVDVKLIPTSGSDEVAEIDATTIQFTMANRVRRPYPPSEFMLNGTRFDATNVSLEGVGSDGEDFAIAVVMNRRDYRRANGLDEIEMLDTDAEAIDPTYPAAQTTTHEIDVRNDPAGANTFLFTETGGTATINLRRWDILRQTDGVLPTTLRVVVRAEHTDSSTVYQSRQDLTFDFTVVTALTGDFNFGALDDGDISNVYTATEGGTFNFSLSSSFAVGDVEYRVNGGTWTQLIAAASTSGMIAGIVSTDTIEIRHLSSDTAPEKHLTMTSPSTQDGYAILYS